MNIKTFDYILDSVKEDLQGYSNFRKCIEAEEKFTFALRYALVIVVRIMLRPALVSGEHRNVNRVSIHL